MKRKIFYIYLYVTCFILFFVLAASLMIGSIELRSAAWPDETAAVSLPGFAYETEDGKAGTIELPHTFKNIAPCTSFTLYTEIMPGQYDSLLVKTVYTHLKLYADDVLIYECGQPGSYPSWLLDPPTMLKIVPLPKDASVLRFEYISPSQRNTASLPAVMAGNETALIFEVLYRNSALLLISLILLFMGIAILVVSLLFLHREAGLESFLWLGLFALAAGCWGIGECNATALLFPYPALLYCIACGGLFTVIIPLLLYGLFVLKPRQPLPMKITVAVLSAAVVIAFALQLMGIASLSKTLFAFHILNPLGIGVFVVTAVWEYFHNHNAMARRFTLPTFILLLASFLEVVNYSWRITHILSFFFLSGTLIFAFMLGVIGVWYIKDAQCAAEEKKQLESEVRFMEQQLAIQKEHYASITQSVHQTKKARHDIRHNLLVLTEYASSENYIKLNEYLAKLTASFPVAQERYCENQSINAVVSHYLKRAENEECKVDVRLDIPEDIERVPAMDLCVVMGNLLENAMEACRRVKSKKFICIRSRIANGTLSVVIKNSFDGKYRERNGVYISRKRSGESGIGLSSVKAICEKYEGLLDINIDGNTWTASALLDMTGKTSPHENYV